MINQTREHELLRRYWYAAANTSDLDRGPQAITILGEQIVVARLGENLLATADRCPHRGAPLSRGEIVTGPGGECLQCPYHALNFNALGAAVHLPGAATERLPSKLNLDRLPCVEAHGIVWVCLEPEPLGEIPQWDSFNEPASAQFQMAPEVWQVMPSRIAENFNDLAHLSFVHAATFGDASNPEVPPETIDISDDGSSICHQVIMSQLDRITLDGPLTKIDAEYTYFHSMPFSTELRIRFDDDRTEWIQMTATPISPTTSLVFQQSARNFDVDNDLDSWQQFQATVNGEDRRLLETIRPRHIALDGSSSGEVALSVDTFTINFRRVWRNLLS